MESLSQSEIASEALPKLDLPAPIALEDSEIPRISVSFPEEKKQIAPIANIKVIESHHKKFAIQFPNLVAGVIAIFLSLAGFQTLLSLNLQTQIAYQNFGNEIGNSIALVSELSGEDISASIFSGVRVPFDKFAQNFYLTMNDVLFDTRTRILVMLGREEIKEVVTNVETEQAGSQDGQGMVVVPVDDKTDKDAVIAKIQNSFSDEVQVAPRADGTSGVITPVFKKINNDEYLYVLVPIKN